MLIYVKNIKKKKKLFTDGQTDGQPKTIVRNLTKGKKRNRSVKEQTKRSNYINLLSFLQGCELESILRKIG